MTMRSLFVVALALLAAAAPATAQQPFSFGVPASSLSPSAPAASSDNLDITDSAVSFIDSALPRNTVRLRLDLAYDDPRPTRAAYLVGVSGLPLPEPRIQSYQDVSAYAEWAPMSFFSVFFEAPMRWLNPEVNQNVSGYGDMNFGFKLCTWNSDEMLATLQVRLYNPTAERASLGTDHWTFEPAFLANWLPYDGVMLEGEVRYWMPLGGGDFAGDIVRYGLGLSIGSSNPTGFWYKPVLEGVGWSVLGGKSMVVTSPDSYYIQSAAGQTIINGYLGMRLGMGNYLDFYAGYGRCFTGSSWARDNVRVELRLFY
jgi:hypothetical protein